MPVFVVIIKILFKKGIGKTGSKDPGEAVNIDNLERQNIIEP